MMKKRIVVGICALLCGLGWHRYQRMFREQSIHHYMECRRCRHRTVQKALWGYQPLHTWWLIGGPWEKPTKPPGPLRMSTSVRPPGPGP